MKDHRLELGRYMRNPFNEKGKIAKKLDFHDLFESKTQDGQYPWNPSRFDFRDLLKRAQSKKMTLNPDLNFVGNTPFFDPAQPSEGSYEMFEGLGRFKRNEDYSFEQGRANIRQNPRNQPDFNPMWVEAYQLSPTINPRESVSNPMPRLENPDPKGYLMATAEKRAESEAEGKMSVASLLEGQTSVTTKKAKIEEKTGSKIEEKTGSKIEGTD